MHPKDLKSINRSASALADHILKTDKPATWRCRQCGEGFTDVKYMPIAPHYGVSPCCQAAFDRVIKYAPAECECGAEVANSGDLCTNCQWIARNL